LPIVLLHILEGRPEQKVKEVIDGVTEVISEKLEVKKEQVRVLVVEIPKTHWGIGGTPVSDISSRTP